MDNKHNKDRKVHFITLINISPQSGEKMKPPTQFIPFSFLADALPAKELIVFLIKCF